MLRSEPILTARLAAAAIAMALAPCVSSFAQDRRPPSSSAPPEQVEQRVSDRGSLGQSLRVMPVDLSPHGFERVYKVPGRDDLLMRSNGALYAVFTQSAYARDPKKQNTFRPVISAATIFYIGKPNFKMIRSTGMRDLSFSPNDVASEDHVSKSLDSMSGVKRLDAVPVDGRAAESRTALVDGRADAPKPQVPVSTDSHASYPTRTPDQIAAAPVNSGTNTAPRSTETQSQNASPAQVSTRPGFASRIDELMRRAKKAQ